MFYYRSEFIIFKSIALCSQDCLTQLFLNDWENLRFSVFCSWHCLKKIKAWIQISFLSSAFILFITLCRWYFFYLVSAALGHCCFVWVFSSCREWGLLILVSSLCSRYAGFSSCGLRVPERRLSSCGAQAQLLLGMWDLPGPRGQTYVPCTGRWIFIHCASREVL